MSILSRLFGGGTRAAPKAVEPVTHEGFRIYAEPAEESGRWRINARIEKEVGGELRTHRLIRADTLESREAATDATLAKARQVIDEQGDRIFD
jgi:hypothetical protein